MKKSRIFATLAAAAMAATCMSGLTATAATEYNAYLGIQSASFTFRNAWNEGKYGKGQTGDDGLVYFDTLIGWDDSQPNVPFDRGGDFTDAKITGDGTYKVSLTGDFDFGDDESLNLLFVSTDIPLSAGATVSDVKVIIDGNTKYTFDEAYLNPDEKEYVNILAINIWNSDIKELFGYVMPNSSVEMEFTIKGLDGAAAEAPAETEAPKADAPAASPATGNAPVAALGAVAAVAAAAVVFSRKRK